MLPFSNRILFVGFGGVARCALPILLRHINVDPKRITIMDFDPDYAILKPWTDQGVTFVNNKVTEDNMGTLLGEYLSAGDLLIDLAWNIDCGEIVQWCHDRGVLYINTSVELWDPYAGAENKHPTERTLYWRHMKLRKMAAGWSEPGPTAVLEHGANPGLISHFTKQALLDIAERALAEKKFSGAQAEKVAHHAKALEFNHLSHELGVKVIHCSERDTQITNRPKEVDEFLNTWSVEGFREEGTTTAEMGWGTHEKELPAYAFEHPDGPKSQICLARMGMNTHVVSWVPPNHHIIGMVVRHGEAFTITEKLTVWKDGKAVYRPTVHYAYCPSDAAIASLHELRGRDYNLQSRVRIMTDEEITSGADILGRPVDGPSVSVVVVRIRSRHRRVPAPGAEAECHDDAGGDFGGGGLHVDAREPAEGHVRAGRPAARLHPEHQQAVSGQRSCRCRRTGRRSSTTRTRSTPSIGRSSIGPIPGSSRTS